MRTGLIAGLISGGTVALLNCGHALSNADFIYMCAGAALLDSGQLPYTPYFPAGYPLLLWLATRGGLLLWGGMTALHSGALLAALGTGLSAGALATVARLIRLPPAPALLLGLLGASLPSVAEIAFNPHVDALFSGLALCLMVGTLAAIAVPVEQKKTVARWQPLLGIAFCGGILLSLRWHAVLIVLPCLLLLIAVRQARAAGLALLFGAVASAGWNYGGLFATYGRFESAAPLQVATGAVYREFGPGREAAAADAIFSDYEAWVRSAPMVDSALLAEAVRANWPQFIQRKAVLAGLALWLLALVVYRRWPPQSHWLLLFILGYPLVVGTTYFTPRASALVELTALLLVASALSLAFSQEAHELRGQKLQRRRLHFKPNPPSLRVNPVLAGGLLGVACLSGIVWNTWRVGTDIWWPLQQRALQEQRVYEQALAAIDGDASQLGGARADRLPCVLNMPWCLPGPSLSRLWMDDPRVGGILHVVLPRLNLEDPQTVAMLSADAEVLPAAMSGSIGQMGYQQLPLSEGYSIWFRAPGLDVTPSPVRQR